MTLSRHINFNRVLTVLSLIGVIGLIIIIIATKRPEKIVQPASPPAVSIYKHSVAGSGIIEATTSNIQISTLVGGIVDKIFVKAGDPVKKNDPLFTLDEKLARADLEIKTAQLEQLKASLKQAEAAAQSSKDKLRLADKVKDSRAISEDEYLTRKNQHLIDTAALKNAKSNLDVAQAQLNQSKINLQIQTIVAPLDGEVLQVNVHPGEYAATGPLTTPLLLLGNTHHLNVRVDIDENEAWRYKQGSKAIAYLRGNGDIRLDLTFSYIEPYVVPKTALTGSPTERVDTRVLQAVYEFDPTGIPAYVGQQVDVFIEDQQEWKKKKEIPSPESRKTRIRKNRMKLIFLCFFLSLSSCTVGPDYVPPEMTMPSAWINGNTQRSSKEDNNAGVPQSSLHFTQDYSAKDIAWWKSFNDPDLTWLIEEMGQSNLDIQTSLAKIHQSRAGFSHAQSAQFPNIGFHGALNRSSGNGLGGSGRNAASTLTTSASSGNNTIMGGFDAAWELDFFGRLRRTEEESHYLLESSIEDGRAVLLSLLSDVAQNYINLRNNQYQLNKLREQVVLWEQYVHLKKDSMNAGLLNSLDLTAAELSLSQTKAQIPTVEATIKSLLHQLALLLGKEPGFLYARLGQFHALKIPVPSQVILSRLPVSLLQQRPDIRSAERQLAASTASIGISVATLFPDLNFTVNIDEAKYIVPQLIPIQNPLWSYTFGLTIPLLDFGRLRADVETKKALQEQSLFAYKKLVLTALSDVETALVRFIEEDHRSSSLLQASQTNQVTAELTQKRYKAGLNPMIDVYQAQINELITQQDYANSLATRGLNLISLYKALGGGWDTLDTFKNQDHGLKATISSALSHIGDKILGDE